MATTLGLILGGIALGAVVSAATAIPQAILTTQAAQTQANYQSAVYMAYARQKDQEAKVEAQEIRRRAKFTFASQRANAAAMGTDIATSSAGDIQYMSAGMAALDEQKKLYEGDLALWEGNVKSQMAQYQAKVTKYNAWTSAAISIGTGAVIGGVSGGIASATAGATGAATAAASGATSSAGHSLGASAISSVGRSGGFFSSLGSGFSRGVTSAGSLLMRGRY